MNGTAGADMPAGAGGSSGGTAGTAGTGGRSGAGEGGSGEAGSPAAGAGGGDGEGVETLGDPCDAPAELACAGHHQRVTLICGPDRRWEVNQTCGGDQACDTSAGLNRGTCQDRLPECRDFEPGHRFCQDEATLLECGPDNVTVNVAETCGGICWDGACDNRPNHCPSTSQGEGFVNCAEDCGGRNEWCDEHCPGLGVALIYDQRVVVRAPSYDGACVEQCNGTRRGFLIDQELAAADLPALRVSVPPPWYVALRVGTPDACSLPPDDCLSYEGGRGAIYVFTDEPGAGPVNVSIVTSGADDLTCPE